MSFIRALCLSVLLSLAFLLTGCVERYYFFVPDNVAYVSPKRYGLDYEEVQFSSTDGTRLHGWYVRAKGIRKGTILYFHGNSKNISGHLRYVEWLPAHGYDVFLFDYRGYGHSQGIPTPQGVHDDCIAALSYVRSRLNTDQADLIIFGQSLGGNYALDALASTASNDVKAVVIEGAFASHREIANDKVAVYPLPSFLRQGLVNFLINDTYDAITAIRALDTPSVLVIHGDQDEVVPYRHAELLIAASKGKAKLWKIPQGRHLDTFVHRGDTWRARLVQYLDNSVGPDRANNGVHRSVAK